MSFNVTVKKWRKPDVPVHRNIPVDHLFNTNVFDADAPNETRVVPVSFENYVLLRLTECDALTEEVFTEILAKYVDKTATHLFVYETGKKDENPHVHGTFRLVSAVQAFRQYLLRKGLKGNQSYSLKVADRDQMKAHFQYLCKGTGTGKDDRPNVGFRSENLHDAVIQQFHKIYWEENQQIAKGNSKRKREEPAAKQILAICRQKIEHGPKDALLEDEIIDITLEWYFKNKWSMNTFQMKAVVNYVSYGLNKDSNRVHLMKQSLKFDR